ncbi:hypothetical protein ABL78_5210 [Leptomonas seymouri]|uniref:Uncharacterized protein n=1 Tax=Leptomonas seymouri TaxID=5684 RepID=A0A0N1HVH6_LEPSE|nr:hypothetical protein ABL78_5210 [Leptomonas seymouri]|eukprot:KPI85723.1 hypothetical protein ABL78_5210 [Leptomonas seymouri]
MKPKSTLNFSPPGGPRRPSAFSVGSGSASRRFDSTRTGIRGTKRSCASSFLLPDSLADCAVGDGALDETENSLFFMEEELRQNAERQAKRLRQLQTREARQRNSLVVESMQQFDNIVLLHSTYAAITDTCVALRASREAKKQHDDQQSQQWSLQLIADAVKDVVQQERASRQAVLHAEAVVRKTTSQLQVAEARGLEFHESTFQLVHAEQVRRAFQLREEARGVEEMNIPHFISLPYITSTVSPEAGRGLDKLKGTRCWRDVDKMDLMAAERCPFRCAADCPYMPPRTRKLGRMWADAEENASRPGRGTTAADSHQQRSISEVGKQRVRYAMAKEHLRDTPNFLESLRVRI